MTACGRKQTRIAQAAGVRQGHLTYYFPTRTVLLEGVVQHMMEGMLQGMQAVAHAHAGKGADALANAMGEVVADPREVGAYAWVEPAEFERLDPVFEADAVFFREIFPTLGRESGEP